MSHITIKDMQELAKSRGGKCLSKEYITAHTKLVWQCIEGHTWKAKPNCIKDGTWCPVCNIHISERICRKYFENIFEKRFPKIKPLWLINSRGNHMELDGYNKKLGIAFEYQGIQHYKNEKPYFKSEDEFKTRKEDDNLKRELCQKYKVILIEIPHYVSYEDMGNFIIKELKKANIHISKSLEHVDYRSFKIYSLEKMKELQNIAKKRRGKCLSDIYINVETKLKWQCTNGHVWEATPKCIKKGNWCPKCAGRYGTIEDMQKIAEKRRGKCLSEEYINSKDKLRWMCKNGHIWEATPTMIKSGRWCPTCAGRYHTIEDMQKIAEKHEGTCLSEKYRDSMNKLKWMCKEGHIWEATYPGINAGQWCPICALKKCGATQRLSIEEMQKVAEKRGGKCLSNKYINSSTKLVWQCKEGHVWQASYVSISMGHWCPICSRKVVADKRRLSIEDMIKIAEKHEGKCLSKLYIDSKNKLEWQCKEGHIWKATYNKIYIGRWCPICGGTSKLDIEEMQKIAEKKGGKCLSKEYINNRTKLRWMCKESHIWEATPHVVRSNHWCHKCSAKTRNEKRKLTIEEMQKVAEKRGGKCLSKEYNNNKNKLRWQCAAGHIWEARPDSVKCKGTWCPRCRKKKYIIEKKEYTKND